MNLVIRGNAYTDGNVQPSVVRVEDGVIKAVSNEEHGLGGHVIDLSPRETLLPAGVETLCALRDWGEAQRDTVECVTKAALASGVTVVCDQPNTVPRINSPDLIRKRADDVAQRSFTDFIISSHPPQSVEALEEFRGAGAGTVIFFPWDLRKFNQPRDIDDSKSVFDRCARKELDVLVLADEHGLHQTPWAHAGEGYAVEALLRRLVPELNVRVMVTLPDSVDQLESAKRRLPKLKVQVAMHSILLSNTEAYQRIGVAAAQTPPLRSDQDVETMKANFRQGRIDIVVSHHCGHRTQDKYNAEPIPGEFTPKVGYSGMDFSYPLLLTKFGVKQVCRTYCELPAMHLGLKKGLIAPGYDADFAIVESAPDIEAGNVHEAGGFTAGVWRVEPSNFHSKGKVTPFVGERLRYRVNRTFLRGEQVYDRESGTFNRTHVRRLGS